MEEENTVFVKYPLPVIILQTLQSNWVFDIHMWYKALTMCFACFIALKDQVNCCCGEMGTCATPPVEEEMGKEKASLI